MYLFETRVASNLFIFQPYLVAVHGKNKYIKILLSLDIVNQFVNGETRLHKYIRIMHYSGIKDTTSSHSY